MKIVIRLLAVIVGLSVFGVWMSIVGNPHVVETVIGLVLAFGTGFYIWYKLRQFGNKRNKAA
jgi:hypothetical protein